MPRQSTPSKQRANEFDELQRLTRSLSSTLSVHDTLAAIADCSLNLCSADYVSIVLLNPVSKDLSQTMVRSSRESSGAIDHLVNTLAAGWIIRHKEPLITDDILETLKISNPSTQMHILGPAIALPLEAEGVVIGMIILVNARGERAFTKDDMRLAGVLAPLASSFLERARVDTRLFEENRKLKRALRQAFSPNVLVGESELMQKVRNDIARVATSTSTVLLLGETGTGKELAARAIHYQSDRAQEPFVAVNCAAIPAGLFESELFGHERGSFTGAGEFKKGRFELADKGTLFLDEISEMPLDLQPKLLRALDSKSFSRVGSVEEIKTDIRVLAATNKDLKKAVDEGKFRSDLFYRLNVVPLHLPPLRERQSDIPMLAQAFLNEFSGGSRTFAADVLSEFQKMHWRGNVRELRNTVERLSILTDSSEIAIPELQSAGMSDSSIQPELFSLLRLLVRSNPDDQNLPEAIEHGLIRIALEESRGNISKASRLLGIDRKALQRRIEKFGPDLPVDPSSL